MGCGNTEAFGGEVLDWIVDRHREDVMPPRSVITKAVNAAAGYADDGVKLPISIGQRTHMASLSPYSGIVRALAKGSDKVLLKTHGVDRYHLSQAYPKYATNVRYSGNDRSSRAFGGASRALRNRPPAA